MYKGERYKWNHLQKPLLITSALVVTAVGTLTVTAKELIKNTPKDEKILNSEFNQTEQEAIEDCVANHKTGMYMGNYDEMQVQTKKVADGSDLRKYLEENRINNIVLDNNVVYYSEDGVSIKVASKDASLPEKQINTLKYSDLDDKDLYKSIYMYFDGDNVTYDEVYHLR